MIGFWYTSHNEFPAKKWIEMANYPVIRQYSNIRGWEIWWNIHISRFLIESCLRVANSLVVWKVLAPRLAPPSGEPYVVVVTSCSMAVRSFSSSISLEGEATGDERSTLLHCSNATWSDIEHTRTPIFVVSVSISLWNLDQSTIFRLNQMSTPRLLNPTVTAVTSS